MTRNGTFSAPYTSGILVLSYPRKAANVMIRASEPNTSLRKKKEAKRLGVEKLALGEPRIREAESGNYFCQKSTGQKLKDCRLGQ